MYSVGSGCFGCRRLRTRWLAGRAKGARTLREDDPRRALQVPERNAQKAALALRPRDLRPSRLRRRDGRMMMPFMARIEASIGGVDV